ncbi:MAG: glycosyl transferase family 4 [Candidatus Diapherotrites archaeon]|uniref:Glycosyl transferase family 4 n=1 Tax=Candidatus Iainarchaeum sp. TaxID=3101447 RepID=A0A8T4KQ61_9ARCH|nr:glycosyl transferase family 4 [Candidatus Diapherotrites archaeon]
MNYLLPMAILAVIAAFFITNAVSPFFIRRMHFRRILGRDMNKLGNAKVAEMGGITVMLGFAFAIIVAIFSYTYLDLIELNLTAVLAAFSTVILIGLLGIIDDLIGWRHGIRQWQHALIPIFAALPLMALNIGTTEMRLPIIGVFSFGIFYSLVIVPIGITGASNAFNMLAGLNGLEAGMGAIISFTMLIIAMFYGSVESAIIPLLAFLRFNWYPARIFPGDSLTLMIGAGLASAVIIGNMEKLGMLIIVLYFAEFLFKARHRFQSQCFGIPQKDGTLKADPRGGSLTQWVMRRGNFTEKQVVLIILGMQALVSLFTFIIFANEFFGWWG